MQFRAIFSSLLAAPLLVASLTGHVRAEEPSVKILEVSTTVGREEVVPALKRTLSAEVAKVSVPTGKRFVLSASLTKLETKTSGSDSTTSCVISIAVRDSSGALRGMSSGRGTIVTKKGDLGAEKAVLDAAVRGATRGLPELMGT